MVIIKINSLLLKHYLKNVMFINGTSYAGKSTMVKMLADKYGLVHCGENYDCVPKGITNPQTHPNLCYFQTMKNWQEFVNRTPQQYSNWIKGTTQELIEFEIMHLISVSQRQKTIVDTNIPVNILHKIADYNQVAIMLSPQSMSIKYFFDRSDLDKVFIKEQIMKSDNPDKTMENFLACMAECNSIEVYDNFLNSGFFTIVREDNPKDTKEETLEILARHFELAL
ncbi:MAG: hypothetical protein FWE24_07255 [Defluviitaleaceae bacterium]|nr:hypothetical protein [Defluviitaleaceae bacterium]